MITPYCFFPYPGVGGNLASILISRMTTRLSIVSKPIITDDVVDRINSIGVLSCLQAVVEKDFAFVVRLLQLSLLKRLLLEKVY